MKNDSHSGHVKKGRIQTKPIRGHQGIFKVFVWSNEKGEYVDPLLTRKSNQKPYRAFRRVKKLGQSKQQARFFDSIEEAKRWRVESIPGEEVVLSRQYTIGRLIDDWREWSKPPRMKLSSWEVYGKDVRHFSPLVNIVVEELTSEDIDDWLRVLIDPSYPKQRCRTSYEREVKTLITMLNWYREYKNHEYRLPTLRRHKRDARFKRKPMKEMHSLQPEEVELFLEHLRTKQKPVYYYLASFQALCGVRIGEACGLFWDAVDLERGTVEIRRICSWEYRTRNPYLVESTKTNEIRTILLAPRLLQLLKEWKVQSGESKLVFNNEGNLIRYNAIQSAYKKAFRANGLPERSTHILRHFFARTFADQTGDIRGTQAILGHSDLRMTQHYAKVDQQTQRNAIPRFAFGSATTDSTPPAPQGSNIIPLTRKKAV